MAVSKDVKSIGILGFGAFGRLVAEYLHPHFQITVSDPQISPGQHQEYDIQVGSPEDVAKADLVILAVPIEVLALSIQEIRPHLRPGTIVADVTSVKVEPVKVMKELLPADVEIVGTHPLFGPQSSFDGISDRKIAICPVWGKSARRIAAFLRHVLKLKVYITSPEEHDKEAAVVQGITHLIAKVLVRMEPLPTRLTTLSFDRMIHATDMVRDDSESVFLAIERENPYSAEMRQRFFKIAEQLRSELETG